MYDGKNFFIKVEIMCVISITGPYGHGDVDSGTKDSSIVESTIRLPPTERKFLRSIQEFIREP